MTLVVMTALGCGVGLVGVVLGLRSRTLSLQGMLTILNSEPRAMDQEGESTNPPDRWRVDRRVAATVADSIRQRGYLDRELRTRLALSNSSLEELTGRCVACFAVGLLLPVVTWIVVISGGENVSALVPVGAGLVLGVGGALIPFAELNLDAKRGLRLAKRAVCSFLDLVVLGLAGGMGIESALLTAAQLGENFVSRRMFAALCLARDTGEPPWEGLSRLGETLGIEELCELAATAGLAGMEGAKVRVTLAARAATIRRHELASAEAEANALTERLFIPGTCLLVGFLIFIGYPAFIRIASGF